MPVSETRQDKMSSSMRRSLIFRFQLSIEHSSMAPHNPGVRTVPFPGSQTNLRHDGSLRFRPEDLILSTQKTPIDSPGPTVSPFFPSTFQGPNPFFCRSNSTPTGPTQHEPSNLVKQCPKGPKIPQQQRCSSILRSHLSRLRPRPRV
jgi:hypothetical protein